MKAVIQRVLSAAVRVPESDPRARAELVQVTLEGSKPQARAARDEGDPRSGLTLVSEIGPGILTLLGIEKGDDDAKLRKMISKIVELRIFEDAQGKMNLSLQDVKGSHLIVSQFTLAGDASSGRRPSFITAERPEIAKPMYERALALSAEMGVETRGGIFQADMKVSLVNDGPVTLILQL